MLGKMLLHGLAAAILIASAAAVYAETKDNGTPTLAPAQPKTAGDAAASGGDGYVRPFPGDVRKGTDGRKHPGESKRRRESRERHRDRHDD